MCTNCPWCSVPHRGTRRTSAGRCRVQKRSGDGRAGAKPAGHRTGDHSWARGQTDRSSALNVRSMGERCRWHEGQEWAPEPQKSSVGLPMRGRQAHTSGSKQRFVDAIRCQSIYKCSADQTPSSAPLAGPVPGCPPVLQCEGHSIDAAPLQPHQCCWHFQPHPLPGGWQSTHVTPARRAINPPK